MRKSRSRSSGERVQPAGWLRDLKTRCRASDSWRQVGVRTMERSFVRVRLCLQSHPVQMPNAGDLRATVDDMTMRRVEGGTTAAEVQVRSG